MPGVSEPDGKTVINHVDLIILTRVEEVHRICCIFSSIERHDFGTAGPQVLLRFRGSISFLYMCTVVPEGTYLLWLDFTAFTKLSDKEISERVLNKAKALKLICEAATGISAIWKSFSPCSMP